MSELIEPLRTGWLKTRLGISHETVARWRRDEKVPGERIEDVMEALRELGMQEEAAPDIPERLNKIEMYLREIAKSSGVPPAVMDSIEAAHQAALDATLGRRRSDAAHR